MTEFIADPQLITVVCAVGAEIGLDDRSLQGPGAQADFLARCAQRLGDRWLEFNGQIRAGTAASPHAVVVRGRADSARALLVAVSLCLGGIINPFKERMPDAPVLHEITPKGPESPDLVWLWHTDSAHWPTPNDYSALACVRPAANGGSTQVLDLDSVRAQPGFDAAVLAPLWESDIIWPVAKLLGGGTFADRCISPHRLRFRRELMKRQAPPYRAAVESFTALVDSCEPDVVALLSPGDVLVFDNRKVMHRAGPVDDPQASRLLLRSMMMDAAP